jgi:hypothetical protein
VLYLGLAAGAVVALPSLGHIGRPNLAYYSIKVVTGIPPHCRLFNTDTLGGFVILERPDVRVSLDSRNDLYGRQLVLAEQQVLADKWLRTSQGWN